MAVIGIDLGSQHTKAVILDGDEIVGGASLSTGETAETEARLAAQEALQQAGIVREGQAPPRGQIFYTATFEDKFGRSRIKLDYNRLFRVDSGLAGAPRIQPRKRIKTGAFLLDFDGRVIGCATVDKKELIEFLTDKVAKWWLPDDVQFVDAIPHTATGKILKTRLREEFKDYKLPTI